MSYHKQIKELYIKGRNVSQISGLLGITRGIIYFHKTKDMKNNIDWDELKLLKATDPEDAQRNEEGFVALLIHTFENSLEDLNKSEPHVQIETIAKHIDTYYKLKQQKNNVKVNKAEMAKLILMELAKIALEKKAMAVIEFLSAHREQIVSTVTKK